MKAWLVLALLAMGLGCSEEPPKQPPEQWSAAVRGLVVEACIDYIEDGADPVLGRIMGLQGITTRDLCRCAQNLLERQFTWGDTDIFWSGGIPDPFQKAMGAVGFMSASPWPAGESILETGCREEMLD
ncbi:MAG TPA: hypothetical protein EYM59_06905 [Acidimicrobiia bacterium]|nr:hypothetical protein [Acidimicrobiia bacterium]